jgi:hypothetical protein
MQRTVATLALLAILLVVSVVFATAQVPQPQVVPPEPGHPIDLFVTPVFWVPFRHDYTFHSDRFEFQRRTPQAGAQVALRYGDFTFGVSGLFLEEQYKQTEPHCGTIPCETIIDYARYDVDYTAAYTFRDVIPNLLNVSLGLTLFTVFVDFDEACVRPVGCTFTRTGRVNDTGTDNAWAIGPPVGLTFRLTDRWFLAVNTTPAWGEQNLRSRAEDKTTNIFFLRNDVSIRYIFNEHISAFVGYKTQVASGRGLADYYAHGPIFGLTWRSSVR